MPGHQQAYRYTA